MTIPGFECVQFVTRLSRRDLKRLHLKAWIRVRVKVVQVGGKHKGKDDTTR